MTDNQKTVIDVSAPMVDTVSESETLDVEKKNQAASLHQGESETLDVEIKNQAASSHQGASDTIDVEIKNQTASPQIGKLSISTPRTLSFMKHYLNTSTPSKGLRISNLAPVAVAAIADCLVKTIFEEALLITQTQKTKIVDNAPGLEENLQNTPIALIINQLNMCRTPPQQPKGRFRTYVENATKDVKHANSCPSLRISSKLRTFLEGVVEQFIITTTQAAIICCVEIKKSHTITADVILAILKLYYITDPCQGLLLKAKAQYAINNKVYKANKAKGATVNNVLPIDLNQ